MPYPRRYDADYRNLDIGPGLVEHEEIEAGTPGDIIERLNREINAGLADSGIMARFAGVGAVPLRSTPAELRARIAADVEKWAKVVRLAGIQPD